MTREERILTLKDRQRTKMIYDEIIKELHIRSRKMHESLVGFGHVFDGKLLKFNDIVESCLRYADCGPDDITIEEYSKVAFSALEEVLASCIKSSTWDVDKRHDLMYISKNGPLTIVYDWMRNPVLVEDRKVREDA